MVQVKAKDHMVTRMCTQARLYQVDTPNNPLSNGGGQHMHRVDHMHMREMESVQDPVFTRNSNLC